MPNHPCPHRGRPLSTTDAQIVAALAKTRGNQRAAGRLLGVAAGRVNMRVNGTWGSPPVDQAQYADLADEARHPHRLDLQVRDGCVIVGSDAHIWPGSPTTAMLAFRAMISALKPKVVILNGDVFDGATLSRHPKIGFLEAEPTAAEELAACQAALAEIEALGPARLIWPLGNHDLRFESSIAEKMPQLAGVQGVHLKDHFPNWEPCWDVWINNGSLPVVVKHRYKGGTHARHNNTLNAGVTMVTGHLHSLGVTPYNDYTGIRFGVDTGTLAVPGGPQFVHYTEDNPVNWRSGFAVLTFRDGRLLWPEVVHVIDEEKHLAEFRGEVFGV